MLGGMVAQIFCGNLTGLAGSYELHVFFRCLSAVCCGQMYTAGQMICKKCVFFCSNINSNYIFFILVTDITDGKYRTIITTCFEQFWSIGLILLPLLASFFNNWTHLYMAISWPTLILIVLLRY